MNSKRNPKCHLLTDWKEQIVHIGDEQVSLQNQFDNLRNDFSDNSPRLDALESGLNSLDGRVINTESDIVANTNRITANENDIDRIDAELVNKTGDINTLANRMTLAEGDIDNIDARLVGIETGSILYSQLTMDADKDFLGKAIINPGNVDGVDVGSHRHSGAAGSGPKINLKDVEVTEDKDFGGKNLTNVGITANSVNIGGSRLFPGRINNSALLYDFQTEIEGESLKSAVISYGYEADGPYDKYLQVARDNEVYVSLPPGDRANKAVEVHTGDKVYIEAYLKQEIGEAQSDHFLGFYIFSSNRVLKGNKYSAYNLKVPVDGQWHKYTYSYIIPSDVKYILPLALINYNSPQGETKITGLRMWRDVNFNSDITVKNIITDGKVDGVDVSEHTHNDTAIGGKAIDMSSIGISLNKNWMGKSIYNIDNVQSASIDLAGATDQLRFAPLGVAKLFWMAKPDQNRLFQAWDVEKEYSPFIIDMDGTISTVKNITASGAITQNNGMLVASCPVPFKKTITITSPVGTPPSTDYAYIELPSNRKGFIIKKAILEITNAPTTFHGHSTFNMYFTGEGYTQVAEITSKTSTTMDEIALMDKFGDTINKKGVSKMELVNYCPLNEYVTSKLTIYGYVY